jgi:pimeloyl-ACP methyl ester carboxylesterase
MMRTLGFVSTLILLIPLLSFCSNNSKKGTKKSETTEKEVKGNISDEKNTAVDSPKNYEFNYNDSLSEYMNAYNKTLSLFKTPVREKDVQTQYGNAHILICGNPDNPPLVLLHGMNASSTMWYPNVKALAKNYCVYAIDFLLEPGKSTCYAKRLNKDEIAGWYDEIFSKLGLRSFYLAGCSRGGWLAMAITLNKPEKVKKLVLLSPAQTFTWIPPNSAILSNVTYSISPNKKNLGNILSGLSVRSNNISEEYLDQYLLGTAKENISPHIFEMTPYSRKSVETLKIPVLVLIGDKDIINNQRCLNKAEKWIADIQTGTIQNAGHFMSFDQPETVNKRILNFLGQ